jgi:hypothetical protein
VLRYDPPPNFYHSAITPPEDYSSTEFNAAVQVYPFRPFDGNIEQTFHKTLLHEWIDPRYQETNVAGPNPKRSGSRPASTRSRPDTALNPARAIDDRGPAGCAKSI